MHDSRNISACRTVKLLVTYAYTDCTALMHDSELVDQYGCQTRRARGYVRGPVGVRDGKKDRWAEAGHHSRSSDASPTAHVSARAYVASLSFAADSEPTRLSTSSCTLPLILADMGRTVLSMPSTACHSTISSLI